MKNIIIFFLVLVLMVTVYFGGQWLQQYTSQASQKITVERILAGHCDPSENSCMISVKQQKAVLSFHQVSSALEPFMVVVETDIPDIEQLGLRFYMQEMDMGYNTFEMEKVSEGHWEKEVILPVCSSGSENWRVELQILQGDHLFISDLGFKQYSK